jgi:hypothetical protein
MAGAAAPIAAAEPGPVPAPTTTPPPPTTPPPLPPAPPEPAGPAPTITLRFAIEPAGAAVELDGVFVTARQIIMRKDDAPHRLRISAPGYVAQEREVRLDDSQRLIIQLRRQAAPAAKPQRRLESRSPYE